MQSISTIGLGIAKSVFQVRLVKWSYAGKTGTTTISTGTTTEHRKISTRNELRAGSRASCTLVGIDQEFLASRALGVDGEIGEIERLRQ